MSNKLQVLIQEVYMVDAQGRPQGRREESEADFEQRFTRASASLNGLAEEIFQRPASLDQVTLLMRNLGGAAGVSMLLRPDADAARQRLPSPMVAPGKVFKKTGQLFKGIMSGPPQHDVASRLQDAQALEARAAAAAARPLIVRLERYENRNVQILYAYFSDARPFLAPWALCQINHCIDGVSALLLSADPVAFRAFEANRNLGRPTHHPRPAPTPVYARPDAEAGPSRDNRPRHQGYPRIAGEGFSPEDIHRAKRQSLAELEDEANDADIARAKALSLAMQAEDAQRRGQQPGRALYPRIDYPRIDVSGERPGPSRREPLAAGPSRNAAAPQKQLPPFLEVLIDPPALPSAPPTPPAAAPVVPVPSLEPFASVAPAELSARPAEAPMPLAAPAPVPTPAASEPVVTPVPVSTPGPRLNLRAPAPADRGMVMRAPIVRGPRQPSLQHLIPDVSVPDALRDAAQSILTTPWRIDASLPAVPTIDRADPAYGAATLAGQTLVLRTWVQTDAEIGATAVALQIDIRLTDGHGQPKMFNPEGASLHTVNVRLESGHYVALVPVDGRIEKVDVISRGDCFYGAVAIGSNYRRLQEVAACHLNNDAVGMRAIIAEELPGAALGDDAALFENYANAVVSEMRQRTAHTLVAKNAAATDPETEMLMRALALGDLDDIKAKLQASLDMARSYFGGSAFASFKNAAEGAVHAHYLLDTFYSAPDLGAQDNRTRESLLDDLAALYHMMDNQHAQLRDVQIARTLEDIAGIYPGQVLPTALAKYFQ